MEWDSWNSNQPLGLVQITEWHRKSMWPLNTEEALMWLLGLENRMIVKGVKINYGGFNPEATPSDDAIRDDS